MIQTVVVVVLVDLHIQRIVLATEETTVTQRVSHRPIKYQSRSWSQSETKVNGSHNGDNLLPKPTAIQIATKSLPGPTTREHRKLNDVKTMFLGTNHDFHCLECCQFSEPEIQPTEKTVDVLPFHQSHQKRLIFYIMTLCYCTLHKQWRRPMSKRFIKPPYSMSRATSIDLDCCRLPAASVLSNKADVLYSNQIDQQAKVSQGHTSCRSEDNRNTEVHGGGGLELVKLAREPASRRPKPQKS